MSLQFTLWDVDHGLCAWILTPKEQTHCIDAGHNNNTDFSPFKQMKENHGVLNIDYLIISHPDKDHIEGLPKMKEFLDGPRVFSRNKTLPDEMKYGSCDSEYQKIFKDLNDRYIHPISDDVLPSNSKYNGGAEVLIVDNDYEDGMSCNDTSLVVFYKYGNNVVIFPGDIEPAGWDKLYNKERAKIDGLIKDKDYTTLVAPHHGRQSGYSQSMINTLAPDLILVSDEYGKEDTDSRYYSINGRGYNVDGKNTKLISTKTHGRIKGTLSDDGNFSFDMAK